MKNVSILGATGSIGTQTLDVLRKEKEDYRLIGISANSNYEKMMEIIEEFNPMKVAMMNHDAYARVKEYCETNKRNIEVFSGMDGLNAIASDESEIIVTSVVGMIGLVPTLKAIECGKDIALANKETLVVAGEIVTKHAREKGVKILPVDSEHGAIFQCLQGNDHKDIDKILITASGGPFRGMSTEQLKKVSVNDALKHPKWNMGRKISIDSATLMNKGLEVIEAHWLFDVDYDHIEAVVHPQSIIHSMVQYVDGSVIAQLAAADMRLPIQYALSYPERKNAVIGKLNFKELSSLTFQQPDMDTFKALKLAYEAGKAGGLTPTILNGANEEAVSLFLQGKIGFLDIAEIIEKCIEKFETSEKVTVDNVVQLDKTVKEFVKASINA